ncbi:alpha/beta hydrolase [Rubellimicrobium arenae]|uniref:alpha/beta hydrolase n=1 Tax=Rubellimicrobium arenae TaxID=2817372 RepID=UPI001B3033CD|nr:dienelactone hydrolase family protein [Rubellimicrobium arenae]
MPRTGPAASLTLTEVVRHPEDEQSDLVKLVTSQGSLVGRLHPAQGDAAVLWVFGSGGGLGGPAGGLYSRLAERLQPAGVTSLELDYRRPGELQGCVMDVLVGLAWLESLGQRRVVLVGHSFGGAVVIGAGALSDRVIAVAALSSQTAGTSAVARLSPRPTLFIHGEADEILPAACSRDLHARAGEPRSLILYPGCRHGLDQCRDALDRDLLAWIEGVLAATP